MRRGTHTRSSLANRWTDDGVCNPVLASWTRSWLAYGPGFSGYENQPGFGVGPVAGYAYSEHLLRRGRSCIAIFEHLRTILFIIPPAAQAKSLCLLSLDHPAA